MAILTVENLSKSYGKIQALKKVSFSVPEGSVFGILGPNGSGKTTMLGTIMDILKPTSGTYRLFDEVPTEQHRRRIGTLLETPNFYHYLSVIAKRRKALCCRENQNLRNIPYRRLFYTLEY